MKAVNRLQNLVVGLVFFVVCVGPMSASTDRSFTVGMHDGDLTLNPLESFTSTEAQVFTALYEGLLSYDPLTLRPVPAVARSWELSEDRLVYRFRLREDARFSNGDPVRAEDFRATWLTMLDPQRNSAYSFLFDVIAGAEEFRTGVSDDPSSVGITVPQAHTLEVRLHEPAPHFLQMLPHHSFAVLHPEALARFSNSEGPLSSEETSQDFIGNGPFTVTDNSDGEMRLDKNSHYWDRRNVYYDRVRLLFSDDGARQTRLFNEGEIDWVHSGFHLSEVRFRETIIVNPMFSTSYYFFRVHEEPWSDARVRRALALLLPWDQLRSEEFHFTPGHTLVPPIPNYPAQAGIQQPNRDEAYQLLNDAGYPGGQGLPELVVLSPGGGENERVFELMRDTWQEELGIEMRYQVIHHPRYFESLRTESYTLGTISWIGDYADPLTFLQLSATSNLNESGFADSEYEQLLRSSMRQLGEERYNTMAAAEAILLDSAVVLPMSHSPAVNLIDLELFEGWYPNPLDIHPFKTIRPGERRAAPGVIHYRMPQPR